MYLKSLELLGFKSFAKKSVFDFTSKISGIVGPNGSGKSNVAESLRFVLGEQSIKSLRGKRGEDLIFNGSKIIPRSNRASVKILFDNTKRFLNIDFDEVAIERVVYRDGVNQYFINSSQVRLRDIAELLSSANIGSSGHHIISQGEADRILNANIKERKEMIEDALGLKVFQYKKQESQKKLQKTEDNISQVELLRKENAPHIRFLKKQVDKVEKSIIMRDELKKLSLEYLKRESEYISFTKKKTEKAQKAPQDELRTLEEKLQRAKEILSKSSKSDKKSDELITIKKEKENQKIIENRTVNYNELNKVAEQVYSQISVAEEKNNISEIKNTLRSIGSIIKNFIAITFSKDKDTEIYYNEFENLKNKKTKIDKNLANILEDESLYNERYSILKTKIEAEKDNNREAEREIFSIMSHQSQLRATLDKFESIKNDLIHKEQDFEMELQEATVLVGRAALDYDKYNLEESLEEIVNEGRQTQEDRRRKIEKIKIRLEEFGGGSGEETIKEYKEALMRDEFLENEIIDLEKSARALKDLIKNLEERLSIQFNDGIEKINKEFQNFFTLMFGGGEAGLSVIKEKKRKKSDINILSDMENNSEKTEEDEDEEEGIDIFISLPHKRTKGLVMLSGGERALTSIALLFAMSQVNPPPFLALDETDAALDEANSKRYGDMIENLSKYSQLILITHNRETMSRAGILYGVTIGSDGISKLLSIKFEEAVQVAK